MLKRPTDKQLDNLIKQVDSLNEVDCVDNIMTNIKSGRVTMRNKWLSLSEYLGFRTTWTVLLILLIFVINLSLYSVSRSQEWQFTGLGTSSLGIIIRELPYAWIAMGLALLLFLIIGMTKFTWSYKFPFAVYIVMLIGGVVFVGTVAFASGVNDRLYSKLVEQPGAGNSLLAHLFCLSANQATNYDRAMVGEVLYHDEQALIIQTPRLEVISVKTTPTTKWLGQDFSDNAVTLEEFQILKMLGKRQGDSIFVATHILAEDKKQIALSRDQEDCLDQAKWLHKNEVLQARRQAVQIPMSPTLNHVQLIKNIY